jgi:RNA polymerase sigma-70 factor (ECF subfamily)
MLARSRALDRLRLTRRESKVVEFDDRVRPILPAGCSREPVEMWQGFVLQAGLRELSSDQRRLVRMAFFDGFSHSEIAEKTDMPLGTVKTRIRAALLRLRGVLMKKELPRES